MVVLVDDRDGARVQVDPEEVRPHLHAALQPVALLDFSQLSVHSIHSQSSCWWESLQSVNLDVMQSLKKGLLRFFLPECQGWALDKKSASSRISPF